MEILPLTRALGAELKAVRLADAGRDDALLAEIKQALLQYKAATRR